MINKEKIVLKKIEAQWITKEKFKPYGQLIHPTPDHKSYDRHDAQLDLSNGIPRFYIMHLEKRGCEFSQINRHLLCTQCLGSLEGKDWLMAVAPFSGENEPDLSQLTAFRIPGNCFIKLELGTWHAGPLFYHDFVDFYNLELSDTNEVDFHTHDFAAKNNLKFEILL